MVVSLYHVLRGIGVNEKEQWEAFVQFRAYLASKCRKGSSVQQAVQWTSLEEASNTNNMMYERLLYNFDTKSVRYLPFQCEVNELKKIKSRFIG